MQSSCDATTAIACLECVCLTWQSVFALLPSLAIIAYLPRVVREATIDEWLLLVFATLLTYASRKTSPEGVTHEPWFVYIAGLWAVNAFTTDRLGAVRSIPLIGVFSFVSVLVPDVISMLHERPEGRTGIPGGNGLMDGIVLKPALAVAFTYLTYYLKVRFGFPQATLRRVPMDARSSEFLLNARPSYRRPVKGWEGELTRVSHRPK